MSWKGRDLGVVVIGDAQVALAADGPIMDAIMFRRTQTGDALEAAVTAARLGVEVAFVTCVASDPFGEWLLGSWEDEHLHLDYARQVGGRNALTLLGADADGREVIAYREGVAGAQLDVSDVAPVPWELTRVLFAAGSTQALGPRPRAAIAEAFSLAREAGVTTVFDPTLRPGVWPEGGDAMARGAFDELAPLVDVLVLDAPYASGKLLGRADPEAAAEEAQRRGIARVVVRRGRRELLVADRDMRTASAAAEPPEALRSGGAIGAFDGALVASLAAGSSLAEAAAVAGQARAIAMGGRAGLDALPFRDQLDAGP